MFVLINQFKSALLHNCCCVQGRRLVLEVCAVLGGGEVHLDVVEGLALAEIVVIGGREEAGAVPPHDRLQEPVVDVERQHLPPVHLRSHRRRLAGDDLSGGGGGGGGGSPAAAGGIGRQVVVDPGREGVAVADEVEFFY